MAKGVLHHVSLEVSNIDRTRAFYDRFLVPIGYRRFVSEAEYLGYTDGTLTFWFLGGRHHRIRRHPPTGDEEVVAEHLAFRMPSEEAVRAREAELTRQEIYPFFPAEPHPEFSPGYFSASWIDPDQIVLELYSLPERKAKARHRTRAATRARRPARGGGSRHPRRRTAGRGRASR
ncbi:MAG: hypothetical protein L3J93_01800 [Thermoplasmata archaeon]|nr:hypothetical protein [Thermoplasmata archaeon]